ncbi:starch synthase 1, chloroplastic/amyloplastic isoform X1 [Senna tora]|uniref:Starch synthase 1, chloroplastic/amyloplastic isoform X1 n=1 Tax=Senna tora TaxID=362788 RepID=A0A834XDP0_9FABA|nr:starch synthase 1, chloroplastic/amyloplastic isoform X1 [Senna tora]
MGIGVGLLKVDLLKYECKCDALVGITNNGIDVSEWDPSSDEHIACHYSADDLAGKVQCKISLQKELGLPIRPDCPLIGFFGRLDYQKGIDLIRLAVPELLEDDVQFVRNRVW